MHMADALVSPAVGGSMWAISAALIGACSRQVGRHLDERKIPLMGVLGAFIFTAQLINFSIPGTGSSGHLGGGLLLAILIGPAAAFLTIASVLVIQALFFADGGLLALGCNIFNLGFWPALLAYPLIYRRLAGSHPSQIRLAVATILAAVVGLQLGSLGVVVETTLSGLVTLPFKTFLVLMQSIHLVIGIVEGLATALVIFFIDRSRPDILTDSRPDRLQGALTLRPVLATLLGLAILVGGILSWFAAEQPDGLEWSLAKSSRPEPAFNQQGPVHRTLTDIQSRMALLPEYALPVKSDNHPEATMIPGEKRLGRSLSGLAGGAATLALCLLAGTLARKRFASGKTRVKRRWQ